MKIKWQKVDEGDDRALFVIVYDEDRKDVTEERLKMGVDATENYTRGGEPSSLKLRKRNNAWSEQDEAHHSNLDFYPVRDLVVAYTGFLVNTERVEIGDYIHVALIGS